MDFNTLAKSIDSTLVINVLTIVLVVLQIYHGYKRGMLAQLLSLLSFAAAILISYIACPVLAARFNFFNTADGDAFQAMVSSLTNRIVWYILIFIAAKVVFNLVIHFSDIIDHIPLLGNLNRLLGAVCGFITAALYAFMLALLLKTLLKGGSTLVEQSMLKPFNQAGNEVMVYIWENYDFKELAAKYGEENVDVENWRKLLESWLNSDGSRE